MDQQIWKWTLTKDAVAPCFVRDVLAMRDNADKSADFFWLGHTPCRIVILVGMVVGIQVYERRTVYTIDDGTAVIDCVLRHPHPILPAPASRMPPKSTGEPRKSNPQRSSPKKLRLDKAKLESVEPPLPITEPGYPVRVVGKVSRHYQSKQILADTIDPCPSSLDEIAHLECVINLHKTKYSRIIPFALPTPHTPNPNPTRPQAGVNTDKSVFSDHSPSHPNAASLYSLPQPPPRPVPVQSRTRSSSIPTHLHSNYHNHTHTPSSPTTSSIASSTPSSPCKPPSPVKAHETPRKPRLRHPSRLHTRDLTANTFRLYVKHYLDNAPSPFLVSCPSPSQSTCDAFKTPTKHARDEDDYDEPTPRPRPSARNRTWDAEGDEDGDEPMLGFTMSHLRRVPELALLAARVVRAEGRKRDKVDREKQRADSRIPSSSSAKAKANGLKKGNGSAITPRTMGGTTADPPRKKMKRLFSWAVIKLFEEGSIVLWDGDVRPLPVPPPPVLEIGGDVVGRLWKGNEDVSRKSDPSRSSASSNLGDASAPALYTSSASASLYSHYHAPRRGCDDHDVDADAGLGCVSDPDPGIDEEAYVPLTAHLLAGHVREAVGALRQGRQGVACGDGGTEPTAENILAYLKRSDGRWAKMGIWVVEEALALITGARQ